MQKLCLTIVVLLCVGGAVGTRTLNSEDEDIIAPLTFRFQPRYLQQVDTAARPSSSSAPSPSAAPTATPSGTKSASPSPTTSASPSATTSSAASAPTKSVSANSSSSAPASASSNATASTNASAPTKSVSANNSSSATASSNANTSTNASSATTSSATTAAPTASAAAPSASATPNATLSAMLSASLYTAAGASSATIVYAGDTSASSTPAVTPQSTITPSTSTSTATTAQTNVESGGGGPDYAGAYANNFTAANVAAQPTTGTTGSPAVTVTAAGSTVIAFDTVLNPAVVYGGMASVNTASNRIIVQGSGSFAEAGLSGAIAIHAIYSTDETVLFFERPHVGAANSGVVPNPYLTNGNGETEIGSVYNIATQTFTPFHFSTNAFCAGHSVAEDGTVIIAGGDNLNLVPGFLDNGLYAIRQLTFPATLKTVVADMGVARWYPTTLTLQDGLIMIAGGSTAEGGGYGSDSALNEPTYQLYNMADGVYTDPLDLPILTRTWPVNLYPYMAVLPVTGSILTIAGAEIDIYNGESNPADFTGLDARYPPIRNLPVPVSYPQTATFALLSLEPTNDYAAEIVVFGGTETDMATAQTPSSSASYRINLGAATPAWETETMPYPRVMGDAVLLPDGTVFVANGGQIGIAGGVPLAAAATDGITTPVLYNPYLAAGSRYTELADSAIQRLYHSNAFLLTSGLVCDTLSFSVMQHVCMSGNVAMGHKLQVS
ncbi:TPA: hypothetical protein ACH3X1_000201 [Trebouxia sp. C0004]